MSLGRPNFYPSWPLPPYTPMRMPVMYGSAVSHPDPADPQQDLETARREEPFRGWKLARVLMMPDGSLRLAGIGKGASYPYRATDVMSCPREHTTPQYHWDETPGCGFYMVRNQAVLAGEDQYGVLCEAEHYGTVVSHELGTRASRQRILSVRTGVCRAVPWCGDAASGFSACHASVNHEDTWLRILLPACRYHVEIPSAEAASRLGTEVRS